MEIKNVMANTKSDFDKEKLAERLAKLTGGVAVIKVGAATEVELKEKKHRIEDAVLATKAAAEEGVVAGGGVALLKASKSLDDLQLDNDDEKIAVQIIKKALEYPIRQIIENAGKEASVVVNEILKHKDENYGYDADQDEFTDMMKRGIIDPKKVTRSALENATSVAGMFLTMEAAVTDLPKKDSCSCAAPHPGMDPSMMM
jgi:chaperonin GroEL